MLGDVVEPIVVGWTLVEAWTMIDGGVETAPIDGGAEVVANESEADEPLPALGATGGGGADAATATVDGATAGDEADTDTELPSLELVEDGTAIACDVANDCGGTTVDPCALIY